MLLAHTKIAAGQEVLASDVPDDPYLRRVLTSYFPVALRERFTDRMTAHRLHREIITTEVVNDMVDRSGITFAFRLNEETGASVPHITEAWLVAREVFDMTGFWSQLKALDGEVDTSAQILALLEGRKLTERATRWLLHFRRPPFDIQATIDFFAAGVLTVAGGLPKMLAGLDMSSFEERRDAFASRGFPDSLADRMAAMVPAYSAFDIVEIASRTGCPVEETAEVYFDLADRLQITRLRDRITALPRDDRWNTMARGALRDDLYNAHAALARDVLTVTEAGTPEQRLAAWVAQERAGGEPGPRRRWSRSGRATRSTWRPCRSRSGRSARSSRRARCLPDRVPGQAAPRAGRDERNRRLAAVSRRLPPWQSTM